MKTNGNITVYNSYFDPIERADLWKHTQVGPVFIDFTKAANVVRSGLTNADSVAIYIPFTSLGDYKSPREFKADQTGWTLKPGDKIVSGLVDFTGPISELESNYDVFTITSVDIKNFGSYSLRHIQVGGV